MIKCFLHCTRSWHLLFAQESLFFNNTYVQIFICFLHVYYLTPFSIRESVLQINMIFNICSDVGACKNMLYVSIVLSLSVSLCLSLSLCLSVSGATVQYDPELPIFHAAGSVLWTFGRIPWVGQQPFQGICLHEIMQVQK